MSEFQTIVGVGDTMVPVSGAASDVLVSACVQEALASSGGTQTKARRAWPLSKKVFMQLKYYSYTRIKLSFRRRWNRESITRTRMGYISHASAREYPKRSTPFA
jgi:hypothetical protein